MMMPTGLVANPVIRTDVIPRTSCSILKFYKIGRVLFPLLRRNPEVQMETAEDTL